MKDRNGIAISVDEEVEWTAQSSGTTKQRRGVVRALLPKGEGPGQWLVQGIQTNTRSDRVVVECARQDRRGNKLSPEYLCPVVSQVTLIPKQAKSSAA